MDIPEPIEKITRRPFEDLPLTIFGAPGIGKTPFCDSAPDSLIVFTEPGQDDFVSSPSLTIKSWRDFQELVIALNKQKEEGKLKYKAVVIDIADRLYKFCLDGICAKKGISYPPQSDFGKTWGEVSNEFVTWVTSLRYLVSVRLIMHVSTQKIDLDTNGVSEETDYFFPSFSCFGKTGGKAKQWLDETTALYGYMSKNKEGRHQITFNPSSTIGAKDRSTILGRLGTIVLPTDPRQDWAHVSSLYRKSAKEMGLILTDEVE